MILVDTIQVIVDTGIEMRTAGTITVLRYSAAQTEAAVRAEVATPKSMDHGLGGYFAGLCVAVETGQGYDPRPLVSHPERYARLDLDVTTTPGHLAAYIHTQGAGGGRKMWRLRVYATDIIGLADRVEGGIVRILSADGVLLRPGAQIVAIEEVAAY